MTRIVITEEVKIEFLKAFIEENKEERSKLNGFSTKKILFERVSPNKFQILVAGNRLNISSTLSKYLECIEKLFDDDVLKMKEKLSELNINNIKEYLLSDNLFSLSTLPVPCYEKDNNKSSKIYSLLKSAYSKFRYNYGHKLIELTKVRVCPYCNRNYIFNFEKETKNQISTTFELDHFFPKYSYPHLALNIYNLVPSCHTCNHKKGTKVNPQKLPFHPFFDNINQNIKFHHKIKDVSFLHSPKGLEIEVEAISPNAQAQAKAKQHITTFNLDSLYKEHKDIIVEVYQKRAIYNPKYLEELSGILPIEKIYTLVFGGYLNEKEINQRPFSKFTQDILDEVEISELYSNLFK